MSIIDTLLIEYAPLQISIKKQNPCLFQANYFDHKFKTQIPNWQAQNT